MVEEELMVVTDNWIPVLAFFERAFGITARPVPGKDQEKRARRYLLALSRPPDDLKFRITLENLKREYDLLDEESALLSDCLALQVKLIQIAQTNAVAHDICSKAYTQAPVCRLFAAMIAEARKAGASEISIRFDSASIRVSHLVLGQLTEGMAIPKILRDPLVGVTKRTEAVGYLAMREFFQRHETELIGVAFEWPSTDSCRIIIG